MSLFCPSTLLLTYLYISYIIKKKGVAAHLIFPAGISVNIPTVTLCVQLFFNAVLNFFQEVIIMILTKLVGFTKFNYVDKDTKEVTPKVQVCFEDTSTIPECGKIYSTYSFKQDNCPDFNKESIGKDIIVELGNIQGRKYGSSIIFK